MAKDVKKFFNLGPNNNWKNYVKKYSYIMKKDPGNKKLKKLINSIA